MAPVRQLIYASSAVAEMPAGDLAQILEVSRRNNAAADVSGALLYADGNFIQVLEGAHDAVEAVYRRVTRDPRHHRVMKFTDRAVAARAFGDWAMGLVAPDALGASDRSALRGLWDVDASGDPVVKHMVAAFLASTPRREPVPSASV